MATNVSTKIDRYLNKSFGDEKLDRYLNKILDKSGNSKPDQKDAILFELINKIGKIEERLNKAGL